MQVYSKGLARNGHAATPAPCGFEKTFKILQNIYEDKTIGISKYVGGLTGTL